MGLISSHRSDLTRLILSTLLIGSISYLMFVVASRRLDSAIAADLLSSWALINTVVLSLSIPLETMVPKMLASTCEHALAPRVYMHGLLAGSVGAVAAVVMLQVRGHGSFEIVVAQCIFSVSLGIFSGARAMLVGAGHFARYLISALANFVVSAFLLLVCWLGGVTSAAWVFVAVAVGNVVSFLVGGAQSVDTPQRSRQRSLSEKSAFFAKLEYKMLGALSLATGCSLLMNNGSIAIARARDIDPEFVVSMAAIISITQVPMTILNNVAPVVNRQLVGIAKEGRIDLVSRVYRMWFRRLVVASLAIVVAVGFGRGLLVPVIAGSKYSISLFPALLASGGVAIDWLSVMPRLKGTLAGTHGRITVAWASGVVVYVGVLAVPVDSRATVLIAPVIGGLTVLLLSQKIVTGDFHLVRSVDVQ